MKNDDSLENELSIRHVEKLLNNDVFKSRVTEHTKKTLWDFMKIASFFITPIVSLVLYVYFSQTANFSKVIDRFDSSITRQDETFTQFRENFINISSKVQHNTEEIKQISRVLDDHRQKISMHILR